MNSIYTIAIGAAASTGTPAYYDEPCSAKMAVSFVDNPSVPSLLVVCLVCTTFGVLVSLQACVYVCVYVCVYCVSLCSSMPLVYPCRVLLLHMVIVLISLVAPALPLRWYQE